MHKVLRLKKDVELKNGLSFKKGAEFEVLNEVVYMGGLPVAINMQYTMLTWINENPDLFVNDTRH